MVFDLTARNFNALSDGNYINLIADARVKVELSKGTGIQERLAPPGTFVKSGSQSAVWYPPNTDTYNLGDLELNPLYQEIEIETQLTASDTLTDIPLEERCHHRPGVESIPPPNPDYVLGSLKQCLGDDPSVLFAGGVDWATDSLPLHWRCQSYMSRPEWRQYQRFQCCSGCGCSQYDDGGVNLGVTRTRSSQTCGPRE